MSDNKLVPADSIRRALNLLGDQWTILILRELFIGHSRYSEIQAAIGAAHATLSRRLSHLVDAGIVDKQHSQRYLLSRQGKDLLSFILAMRHWQLQWQEAPQLVRPLLHLNCNAQAQYPLVCSHCQQVVRWQDVERSNGKGAGLEAAPPQRHLRRGKSSNSEGFFEVPAICKDQRAAQVLNACFQGHLHFQQLQAHVQLPPQVIATRLTLLCELDFLQAAGSKRRDGYTLTERAYSFYPVLMALGEWAAQYLANEAGPPEVLRHKCCGALLKTTPQCSNCNKAVHFGELQSL